MAGKRQARPIFQGLHQEVAARAGLSAYRVQISEMRLRARRGEWECRRAEFERREAEGATYREEWIHRLAKRESVAADDA
jgi:hypothetical protein